MECVHKNLYIVYSVCFQIMYSTEICVKDSNRSWSWIVTITLCIVDRGGPLAACRSWSWIVFGLNITLFLDHEKNSYFANEKEKLGNLEETRFNFWIPSQTRESTKTMKCPYRHFMTLVCRGSIGTNFKLHLFSKSKNNLPSNSDNIMGPFVVFQRMWSYSHGQRYFRKSTFPCFRCFCKFRNHLLLKSR